MSAHHTLAKNTLLLTAASVLQKVIAFAYFTVVANVFGDEGTGAYFLALALITTIGVLDDIGLTSVLTREVARKPEDAKAWLQHVLGYKLFTIPVTVVLACVVPGLMGFDAATALLVRVAIGVMIADTLSLTFYGVLRGLQNLRFESVGMFMGQLFTACTGVVLIATGEATLLWLVLALVVGSVWNALFSGYQVVRRLGWDALRPSFAMGTAPLKAAFAFFLAGVFVKVYGYLDSFVLQAQLGVDAVGVYSVAYKLTYAFQFLPLVFVGALYPSMAASAGDSERLRKIFLAAEWYMALVAAPIVFGIATLAPEIIALLYKPTFAPAAGVLQVLIFALLLIFLDFPVGSLLNATHRQYTKTWIMGGTMVVNAVGNFLLIPVLGIPGAAIAALLGFTFMLGAGVVAAQRVVTFSLRDLAATTWRFFVAGAVMGGAVLLVKPLVPLVAAIAVGAVVYVGLLFLSRAVTVEHMRALQQLVRRKSDYAESPVADV